MIRVRLTLAFSFLTLLGAMRLFGQFQPASDTLIRTCAGTFLDSGGTSGAYAPNERYAAVLCPDGSGTTMRMAFFLLDLGPGDTLCIYDGADTSSALLACLSRGAYPDTLFIQATAGNPSGCLTVVFRSDAAGQGQGWQAALQCGPACQPMELKIDSISGATWQADSLGLGACLGAPVFLSIKGIYPQNGLQYAQSDLSTRFVWRLGRDSIRQGPELNYLFPNPGQQDLWIQVSDIRGCRFQFFLPPIRVSPRAVFIAPETEPLCLGDTIRLNGARGFEDPIKRINVLPGSAPLPDGSVFRPEIAELRWRFQPGMFFQSRDSVAAVSDTAGLVSFVLLARDTFGCVSDTMLSFEVLPAGSPQCPGCFLSTPVLEGQRLCPGDSVQVDARVTAPEDSLYAFKANPQYFLGYANHPPGNPYSARLPVSSVPLTVLDDPGRQILQVCMTITTDWAEDLDIFLRAPSGELLELTTGNGGGFDDYRQTCFSPAANIPITAGEAPFTGLFRPEGDWNALRGARVKGDWALMVADRFDSLQMGRVESWSITFQANNEIVYQWSPSTGLSCADCPEPVIRPVSTTTYRLEVSDRRGCFLQDSLTVQVADSIAAPQITCGFEDTGIVQFSWNPVAGVDTFEAALRIAGRDSFFLLPASQNPFVFGRALNPGDSVRLQLTALAPAGALFCGARTGSVSCFFQGCTLQARLSSKGDVRCFGGNDGFAVIEAVMGSGGFQYQLNGNGAFQNNPRFERLAAGAYFVVVRDQTGCIDTVLFELLQPGELRSNIQIIRPVSCAGGSDGIVEVSAAGGTGPYRFAWNNGAQGSRIEGLAPGTYRLTLTDDQGCTLIDSVFLAAPSSLTLRVGSQDPACTGDANGLAFAAASGGTGPLLYTWDNGGRTDTIRGLRAGTFCVTVTDSRNCQVQECVTLSAPAALKIDSFSVIEVDCPGRRTGEAIVWVSGGTRPYDYVWSDSLAQVGPIATMLSGGNVWVTVRDARGCTLSESVNIPAPTPLQLALISQPVSCRGGADGAVRLAVSGGTSPFSLNWNNGMRSQDIRGLTAGTYSVTATDARGCQAFGQSSVPEPATLLSLEIVQTQRGCFGEKRNAIRVSASGGGASGYSYRWNNGATTAEVSGLDSLSYAVTVTDANGCSRDTSLKLNDLPDMDPNMIVNLPFCFNGSNGAIGINFIAGRPNADLSQYRFVWNTGTSGPTINDLKGDQTYTVTVTDPEGCTAVESRYLRQPRPITAQLAVTDVRCFGGSDGSATITSIDADTRNFSFQWNILGSTNARTVTGLRAGTYRVTITDEFNCTGEVEAVVRQPAALAVQFVQVNNRCSGDQSGVIQAFGNGGTPPYQFIWSDGGTGSERRNLRAGTYRVTVNDANGCQASGQAILQAANPLLVAVETRPATCHGGRDGVILVSTSGGRAPFQYSIDGRNFRPSPTFIGLRAGNYDVVVQDANGCQTIEKGFIGEPEPFEADAGPSDVFIKLGDTLILKARTTGAQGPVRFSWIADFPGTLSCTECDSTVALTQNTISYVLNAVDSAGCQASDRITVNVRKDRDILVPTGFTPNGDGNNDLLLVHGLSGTRILRFRIFDRWGELVYERSDFVVNDVSVGWDGTFRGQPLNPGVFVWYLEAEYIDGFREIKRGQTTLIR